MSAIGSCPDRQVSEQKSGKLTFKAPAAAKAVPANKAAVEFANRASRKLPFVQLPFPHRLRLLSWILLSDADGWKVVDSRRAAFCSIIAYLPLSHMLSATNKSPSVVVRFTFGALENRR